MICSTCIHYSHGCSTSDTFLRNNPNLDLWRLLGVPPNAGQPAILSAYCKQVKNLHPDKLMNIDISEEERDRRVAHFQLLSEARDILINPTTRQQYVNWCATRNAARDPARGRAPGQAEKYAEAQAQARCREAATPPRGAYATRSQATPPRSGGASSSYEMPGGGPPSSARGKSSSSQMGGGFPWS